MFVGTVKVKLSKEREWEGRTISVIELDFNLINGAMLDRLERETLKSGNVSAMHRPTSSEYCSRLASEISGVPFRFIEKLPFYDFELTWQTVAAFISHKNPQRFYNDFISDDDDDNVGFTNPAAKPEEKTETKPESTKPENTKPATK